MAAPEGYTEIGLIGFTDKGDYSSTETYIKNDLVHKGNRVWKCIADNTTGITPAEGNSWELFVEGIQQFYGALEDFPEVGDANTLYIDDTVSPRLLYTWDPVGQEYVLTGGGSGGGGGGSAATIDLKIEHNRLMVKNADYSKMQLVHNRVFIKTS